MDNFNSIHLKLEAFIKRYHCNELLKGTIFFLAIGLLYFLFTLFVEHILWLNTSARTVLFWLFIAVELFLLTKFIVLPLARLFRLRQGINHEQAAKLIGKHFPEVNDKLLNVLQLNYSNYQSELLQASIAQKSLALHPIPFKSAVNFKSNLPYLKYVLVPLGIFFLVYITGNLNLFSDSYQRVVHYKTAYQQPAPFQFFIMNNTLNAVEGKDFKLLVKTAGNAVPENVQIHYNNETYVLQQTDIGAFEYMFTQPRENITFNLSANTVTSKPYELRVAEVPTLLSFTMKLQYPSYTNKPSTTLKSTGNALVPEGTKIDWQLKTKATTEVMFFAKDTLPLLNNGDVFSLSRIVKSNLNYTLSTSNQTLKHYESLSFTIDVVKDEYPELNVKSKTDSLDAQTLYFYGQISDDYGINKLQMVYYPIDNESNKTILPLSTTASNIQEFYTAFPSDLSLEEGVAYQLYFQVFDNDAVNYNKSTKSQVFSYRKRTYEEEKERQLATQQKTISQLNTSLQKYTDQDKRAKELSKTGKEKETLNYNDKKKLATFIKRQEQQDAMMKQFNQKLKDNLEHFDTSKTPDNFKEDLEKRLRENESQLKKSEALLNELKQLQDKIDNEDLVKKIEDIAKQNTTKQRSLEQLLELTKRYYVEKKLEQLADNLKKLAKSQDKIADLPIQKTTVDDQKELNNQFKDFKQQIEALQAESKALKKPIDIPRDQLDEKAVDDAQKNALNNLAKTTQHDSLNKPNTNDKTRPNTELQYQNTIKESQKNAAKKLNEMAQKLNASMQSMGGEQLQEDISMLRQILDNLVLFSFDQEALMDKFKSIDINHNKYASFLKQQNNLKENFEHVDDSLFALSLRQPKLSAQVNKEIEDVYFNIDKALARFAESELYQGISSQQFAITSTNNLADMLSDILDNMQESMNMSPGSSSGGDMQLPDIIMSQEQLNQMMQQGMKQSQQGKAKNEQGQQKGNGQPNSTGNKEQKTESNSNTGKPNGNNGSNQQGNGEGQNYDEQGLLYEIYQKQQQLREALEKRLEQEGKLGNASNLTRQMEEIELELLNNGFTNNTLKKMLNLKHQLLKLENASLQQGEDEKRTSETNGILFYNNTNNTTLSAKQYFQTTEILSRQALPLQQTYKKKVQYYFKKDND